MAESPLEVASIVVFSDDVRRTAAFYAALGVPLEDEVHDDSPPHAAADIRSVHFAAYQAQTEIDAAQWRSHGSTFVGFYVEDLDMKADDLRSLGTRFVREHEARPWGCRIVVLDPDGRAVEINQRDHCRK